MPAPCGMALIHKAALHGSGGQGTFNFRGNVAGNVHGNVQGGTFPVALLGHTETIIALETNRQPPGPSRSLGVARSSHFAPNRLAGMSAQPRVRTTRGGDT